MGGGGGGRVPFWDSVAIHMYTLNLVVFLLHVRRVINGVKDMIGFRQTFNLSYTDDNSTSCEVDLESSSTLVWKFP